MTMKKIFDIKYWWIDLILIIIGYLMNFYRPICACPDALGIVCDCSLPITIYIAWFIIILAILHFVISLIVKIYSKKN